MPDGSEADLVLPLPDISEYGASPGHTLILAPLRNAVVQRTRVMIVETLCERLEAAL